MNRTKIEYLHMTWNPIAMRCTPVSGGCRNCWHLAMAKRLAKNPMIDERVRASHAGGIPTLNNKELEAPLHLRKPARIGVQFMGDLFHGNVFSPVIMLVINQILRAERHQFFLLTKRVERALILLGDRQNPDNLWLGVSVEDQKNKNRINILKEIAVHRFISFEPLLEDVGEINVEGISWIIAGGKTGPGARPLHPDWVRSLRDKCQAAGVPFFFKGWGEWIPRSHFTKPHPNILWGTLDINGNWFPHTTPWNGHDDDHERPECEAVMLKIGHKHSGHLIDGKEWRELPQKKERMI